MSEAAQKLKACGTCGSMIVDGCKWCKDNKVVALPKYAGFWLRVAAFIIDLVVITLFIELISSFIGYNYYLNVVMIYFYRTVLECSKYQGTIGKGIMGLKVTDLDGEQIDFNKANFRYVIMLLSSFALGIGFLMALFTKKKQTLHDTLTKTLVVKG